MQRPNLSITLAVVLLVMGVIQWIRPFSGARLHPGLLILAAALLLARWAAVRQRRKRLELLNQVPKHPLGLSGDED